MGMTVPYTLTEILTHGGETMNPGRATRSTNGPPHPVTATFVSSTNTCRIPRLRPPNELAQPQWKLTEL